MLSYRPDIDGLRAVAVLSVLVFHASPHWLTGGFAGVDIFFVISGYLITSLLLRNLHQGGLGLIDFYARRIKRIFPALLLVLSCTYGFGWFALLADEYMQLGKHTAAGAGFVANLTLWNESGYFDRAASTKPLLHLWSLSIEEQFYLLWPILLWLFYRRKNWIVPAVAVLAALSFGLSLYSSSTNAAAAFYAPQNRFWEPLVGALLACWQFKNIQNQNTQNQNSPLTPGLATMSRHTVSILSGLLLLYGLGRLDPSMPLPAPWVLLPILASAVLIACGPNAWFNHTVLSNPVLVWFGGISYPLYLWHWPLLSYATIIESGTPNRPVRLALLALALLLAWLSYRFVERPIRFGTQILAQTSTDTPPRHGRPKRSPVPVFILTVLMLLLGSLGYAGYLAEGYPKRSHVQNYVNNQQELRRTPERDADCLTYVDQTAPLFNYCRYTDAAGLETVAVVGDSHAHSAYPGIAAYLAHPHGPNPVQNTVLLANSACPPLLGYPTGPTPQAKRACQAKMEQIITTLKSKKDIKKVFLLTRGTVYMGSDQETSVGTDAHNSAAERFGQGLQNTINALSESGKKVYYISENPTLPYNAEACIPRPLRYTTQDCRVPKSSVLQSQQAYLNILNKIQSATIIASTDGFCPTGLCTALHQGKLLYADTDHLSVSGSQFQVQTVLQPYLHEP